MKFKSFIFSLFAALMFIHVSAADRPIIESFEKLDSIQPTKSGDKIEVVEVFWYGCPHCYSLEPYLEQWLESKPEDVEFRRIPGVLGKNWIPHARAYFTAEKLGIVEKIHGTLFDAIHKDNKAIMDEKRLRSFFAENGVDKDEFDKIYQSQEVTDRVKEAFSQGQAYKLTGVPAIIVNGKYFTSSSTAGSHKNLINVINYLIEQERKSATDKG